MSIASVPPKTAVLSQKTPTPSSPTPRPVQPQTRPQPAKLTIAAEMSKVQAVKTAAEKHPRMIFGNTRDLGQQFFRAMIYGPTSARKTVTAAQFGTPEEVRIILTRRKEQLRGLEKNFQYEYVVVDNADDLEAVICHPESFWADPTWVNNPNRTLIIDDDTEGINLLVDDNSYRSDGSEVKDARWGYKEAGKALRTWNQLSLRARQHVIHVAVDKTKDIPGGERVFPDLPPSMQGMLTTDLDYVFYIKTNLWRFIVERKTETIEKIVDGKKESLSRFIFAKNKQPAPLPGQKMIGNGIFGPDEPMDLRAIWNKIVAAKKGGSK